MKPKMITPNCLELAQKELATVDIQDFKIPTQIQLKEAPYYAAVCLRSRENADKLSHTITAEVKFCMPSKWDEMQTEAKSGRVTGVFNGMFKKVVILHNPTKVVQEVQEVSKLSNTTKGKVKSMHLDNIPAEEIAKVLEADLELVKAHIEKIS